jgi:hypothetical protein
MRIKNLGYETSLLSNLSALQHFRLSNVFEKIILRNLQKCLNLILFLDWNKLANFKTLTLVK